MKQQAIELFEQGVAIREIARRLEKNYSTVHGWVKKHKDVAVVTTKRNPSIFVIPDTQVKHGISLGYIHDIGFYIAYKKPEIIQQIGDFYDMESLSSYDKGKKRAEGKRFINDLNAGNKALEILMGYINSVPNYKPRMVMTLGNHEQRIDRYAEDNPEWEGLIGTDKLAFQEHGWEVYPFLKPVEICGIYFVHYLKSKMSSNALGGSAARRLDVMGDSYVMGHQQTLDVAMRKKPLSGKKQIGIICGACYDHDEAYMGYQGNQHYRGALLLHNCHDGYATHTPIELEYMKQFRKDHQKPYIEE